MMKNRPFLAALFTTAATSPALAHPGHLEVSSFAAGLAHPIAGLDHVLAMVVVGIWGAQYASPRGWLLPGGFLAGMLAGAGIAYSGAQLPAVESGIALSMIALGAALSLRMAVPLAAAVALTAIAGLVHGHAHGLEASGDALPYMAGFIIATAALHGIGGAMGLGAARMRFAAPVIGALTALAGFTLLAG